MTQSIPGTLYVKKEKATLRKKPIEKFTTKITQIYQKTKSNFPHLNNIKQEQSETITKFKVNFFSVSKN